MTRNAYFLVSCDMSFLNRTFMGLSALRIGKPQFPCRLWLMKEYMKHLSMDLGLEVN